jgi:hypothetical protein
MGPLAVACLAGLACVAGLAIAVVTVSSIPLLGQTLLSSHKAIEGSIPYEAWVNRIIQQHGEFGAQSDKARRFEADLSGVAAERDLVALRNDSAHDCAHATRSACLEHECLWSVERHCHSQDIDSSAESAGPASIVMPKNETTEHPGPTRRQSSATGSAKCLVWWLPCD